jgi:hypothetical protein
MTCDSHRPPLQVRVGLAVTPRHGPFDFAQGRLIGGHRTGTNASCCCDTIRDSRIATTSANKTLVDALGMNGLFDCGSRKAAWRSSILLPLLQCSLRDL